MPARTQGMWRTGDSARHQYCGVIMSKAMDTAYRFIRGAILDGSFAAGEQLREEHLAEACGVSRTPVREALRRLESEHFIRRTGSQRTFVADWSLDEIEESFLLRAMLESRAAARAAVRIDDSAIALLANHNRAISDMVKTGRIDVESFLEHNREFHAIITRSAGSERLSSLLAGLIEQPIVVRTVRQYSRDQIDRSITEHEQIITAFKRRDPQWASAIMTAHVHRAYHTYRDAFLARQHAPEQQAAE